MNTQFFFRMFLLLCVTTPFVSSVVNAQQPLLLPGNTESSLILGAVDRFVIPANGKWEVTMAPERTFFSSGALFFDKTTVFAGTTGNGLYIHSSPLTGGKSAVSYKTMKDGLAGDIVISLSSTPGGLWVGTDGGLSLIEGDRIVSFSQWNSSLPPGGVTHIVPSGTKDSVWALTRFGGALVSADLSVSLWPQKDSPPSGEVMSAALWEKNNLVVATPGTLFLLRDGLWRNQKIPFSATSLLWLENKGLLAASLNGLFLIDTFGKEPVSVFTRDEVKSLAISNKTVWITTVSGVKVAGNIEFLQNISQSSTRQKVGFSE